MRTTYFNFYILTVMIAASLMVAACARDMRDQAKFEPFEESLFFKNKMSARLPVEGTVARGQLNDDDHFYTGRVDGDFVEDFPFPITRTVLERGRERYDIYCSVCHGRTGYGDGMIVKRGFPPARSFHSDKERTKAAGYYYNVITNGFGMMYGYAAQIPPKDRWAIVAYVRALQLSQNATMVDVPADERKNFLEMK